MSEKEIRLFLQDPENGLIQKMEDDDFEIEALYRPTDFIVKQQMEKDTQREIDSLTHAYSKYVYFTLTITKRGKDLEADFAFDQPSFAEKISYLSNGFSADLRLEEEGLEHAIVDYVYTRSYGSGPSYFLLVFERPQQNKFDLVIEGYAMGFGKTRFPFYLNDIKRAPNLKF